MTGKAFFTFALVLSAALLVAGGYYVWHSLSLINSMSEKPLATKLETSLSSASELLWGCLLSVLSICLLICLLPYKVVVKHGG